MRAFIVVCDSIRGLRLGVFAVGLAMVLASLGCQKKQVASTDAKSSGSEVMDLPVDMSRGPTERDDQDYEKADFRILFIGNSHTSTCLMPKTVETMLNLRQKEKKVYCEIRAGSFLVDHLSTKLTPERIKQGKWDLVVLQAQKYSMSGKFNYPYDAALKLTKLATQHGAKVIMYPEWGQRKDNSEEQLQRCLEEAQRVHQLHEKIVKESGAYLAPVGLAWNQALTAHPEWELHSDGNHANLKGAFLTARVFDHFISTQVLGLEIKPETIENDPVVSSDVSPSLDRELTKISLKTVQDGLSKKSKLRDDEVQ